MSHHLSPPLIRLWFRITVQWLTPLPPRRPQVSSSQCLGISYSQQSDSKSILFSFKSLKTNADQVLMHKRRVTPEHLNGTTPAKVCEDCHEAFWKTQPKLSKWCLSNYNWLGRHLPVFRDATLGHQLLLALGRVVSTKVYLSSKGVDVVSRQHLQSWRKKFLQQGMSGTAIVYGNGGADEAMASFPPDDNVLQDSFMAVFTGPESEVKLTNQRIQQRTHEPINQPTDPPTHQPTHPPTKQPTHQPTRQPTSQPGS